MRNLGQYFAFISGGSLGKNNNNLSFAAGINKTITNLSNVCVFVWVCGVTRDALFVVVCPNVEILVFSHNTSAFSLSPALSGCFCGVCV